MASPEVLDEYQVFLNIMQKISRDNTFKRDTVVLHKALSVLTLTIRDDLLGHTASTQSSEIQND